MIWWSQIIDQHVETSILTRQTSLLIDKVEKYFNTCSLVYFLVLIYFNKVEQLVKIIVDWKSFGLKK